MLARVRPYAEGCPPQTLLLHVIDATKAFCRRSLVWNLGLPALTTVAGQAVYALPLPPHTTLVRVLVCDLDTGTAYWPLGGSMGRAAVRNRSSNVCAVLLPSTITLTPPPALDGQPLLIDVAVQPDDSGDTDWPDELQEHVEFIAAGAIGSLLAMPGVTWRDLPSAADNRTKFDNRVNALYHRVSRDMVRSPRSFRPIY